jgi:hypothetical protein
MNDLDRMREVADRIRSARLMGMRLAVREGDLRILGGDQDQTLSESLLRDSETVIDLMLSDNQTRRDCSLDPQRFAWYRGRIYRFGYWNPTTGSFLLKPFGRESTFWVSPRDVTVLEDRPGPEEIQDPVTGQTPRDFEEEVAVVGQDRSIQATYKGRRYRVLAVSPRGPVHLEFLDRTGHFWAKGHLVSDYRDTSEQSSSAVRSLTTLQ